MFKAIDQRLGALCALLGLALSGCDRASQPPPAPARAVTAPAPSPTAPLAPPTLGRADLLHAIAAARASYAAGQPGAPAGLSGRQFAIRQPFGCTGPSGQASEGQARWYWAADGKAIEVRLTAADWTKAPVMAGAGASWEAVEGFWLMRPWLETESCPPPIIDLTPVASDPTRPVVITPPVAGLAAVFEAGGSRVGRRDGRDYAFTLRGEPVPEPPLNGYRLVLEGRFAAFPDGRTIRCRSPSLDAEPVCVAAATIDRVALEDAAGKVLREWRQG